MAKSKSFFGLRRGSTKSMTFQVLNGQQITKDRVSDVKNPRTQSQMIQRMVMTTAAAAYEHMKAICDHSFEGVSYGQRSMSRFMSLNVKNLISDVRGEDGQYSYNPYGDSRLYAGPYIVSQGSLKFNQFQATFGYDDNKVLASYNLPSTVGGGSPVSDCLAAMGVHIGDYITLVSLANDATGNNWHFNWVRLRVIAALDEEWAMCDPNDVFQLESNLEISDINLLEDAINVSLVPTWESGDEAFGTAILSRKSNKVWKRSNAQIIFPGAPVNSPTAAEALATYPIGTDYILNGGGNLKPSVLPLLVKSVSPSLPVTGVANVEVVLTINKTADEVHQQLNITYEKGGVVRDDYFNQGSNNNYMISYQGSIIATLKTINGKLTIEVKDNVILKNVYIQG